jgi:serine/threonine protein kinase
LLKEEKREQETGFEYLKLEPTNLRPYLSPEQYRLLLNKVNIKIPNRSYDLIKSDVYSLGLILLETSLMDSNFKIYKEYDVDQAMVKQKLLKFGATYPQNNMVKSVLYKMLEYNPLLRPDFTEILNRLPEKKEVLGYF